MSKDTIHVFNNLNIKGVIANGEIGTAGQVLHSNGTATYWAIDENAGGTVTSVATANGLSGGPITTTGTLGVVSGSTLTVNVSGIHVNTANLSIATSQLTGDVALGANTSGNYVATITAGNGISGSSTSEGGTPTIAVVAGRGIASNSIGVHVIVGNSTVISNTLGVYVNAAALSIATSQLTGDVALGTNTSGNYVATITNANGISGSSSAEGGTPTIGVVTGSSLTVNTTGIHVNSALSITDLALSGNLTVSGTRTYINTTTLEVGDNIVTLNADLGANPPTENAGIEIMRGTSANAQFIWDETNDRWSTNGQPIAISSLVAAGAASGITTLAAGNTTITGFANVGTSLQVGTGTYGEVVTTQFASVFGTGAGPNPYSIMQVRSNDGTTGMGMQAYAGLYSKIYTSNGFVFTTGATIRDKDYPTGGTTRATLDSTGLTVTGIANVSSTLAAGNTTITGFANVTGTIQGGSSLTIAGAASGITTLAAGNTTITGFANVAGSITSTSTSGIRVEANDSQYRLTTAGGQGWRIGTASTSTTHGKFYIQGSTDGFVSSFINAIDINTSGNVILAGTTQYINTDKLLLQHDGTHGYIRSVSASSHLYLGGTNQNTLRLDTANYTLSTGSMRAPLFYDSDNTTYYTDPAGTSVLNAAIVNGTRASFVLGSLGVGTTVRLLSIEGNYDTGQYAHRFRKEDVGGGVPLSLDYSMGTAGSYTQLVQWGPYTGDGGYLIRHQSSTRIAGNLMVKRDANSTNVGDSASIVLSNKNTSINGGIMGGIFADTFRDVADPHYTGGVWFTRNQTSGNLASGSDIVFGTKDNNDAGALPTERMRITSAGNVGIGTTSNLASNKLVVYGDISTDWALGTTQIGMKYIDGTNYYLGMKLIDSDRSTHIISKAADGTGYIAFDTGTTPTERLRISAGGVITASVDIRAPIFYDSNNTAYYLDPASTSTSLNAAGNITTAGGVISLANDTSNRIAWNNNGVNPPAFTTYSTGVKLILYDSIDASSTGYTIGINNSTMFFTAGTTGDGFKWYAATTNFMSSNTTGLTHTGTITASSLYATIYYDSDNTAYYTNPNTTSNLYGLTVNQVITGSVSGSANHLPTRYDSGQKTNPQQYFGQGIGLRVAMTAMPVVWADTLWINGYAGGDVLDMCALHFSRQGTPKMWISTQQSTATSYGTFYELPSFGYNSGNTGDLYAGIFKDSNNTAYYVDSDSTSRMNTISLDQVNVGDGTFLFKTGSGSGTTRHLNLSTYAGDPSQAQTGQSGITWGYRSDNEPYYMIYLTHGDYSGHTKLSLSWHTGIRIGASPTYGGTAFYANSLNLNPALLFTVGRGDDNVRSLTTFRAPIMYDIDNGAYYVDPASTSVLNALTLGGRSTTYAMYYQGFTLDANTMDHNATGFTYAVNAPYVGPIARLSAGGGYDLQLNAPYSGNGNKLSYRTRQGDAGIFNSWYAVATYGVSYSGELFATKFTDADSSGYYVDPAGESVLSTLTLFGELNLSASGTNYIDHTGNILFRNQSGYATTAQLTTGGILSAAGDMRAPIFYDNNDTGRYVDPNASSNMYRIVARQSGVSLGSGNSGQLEISNAGSGACNITFHRESQYGAHFGLDTDNWFSTFGWSAGAGYTNMRVGAIQADVYIRRTHSSGHLRGGYNNIGASEGQTSPIYTIGSSYEPAATTLSNMYGIGFTAGGSFFPSGASAWGMYVASDGVARIFLSGGNGEITATGNITAYASDKRLKTNITPITNAIDKLMQINGVEFDWVDNIQDIGFIPQQMHETGVIAQEIQAVIPDAVKTAPFNNNATDIAGFDSDYLTVDKEKIIPLLIEAIKEQQAHINKLETKINSFEQRLI